VAVAQITQGVNQVPAASSLAAVFGRWGHPGILVWDNNESGGALRWRSTWAEHGATVPDLVMHLPDLLQPIPPSAGLAVYVHRQAEDRYDVLQAGNPADSVWRLTTPLIEVLHTCLTRYYELILVDIGRDLGAVSWRAAVGRADQLVVVVGEPGDAAAAARLLDTLRWDNQHSRALAHSAIIVVAQSAPGVNVDDLVHQLDGVAPHLVTVPYDPGLQSGLLRYTGLTAATQRAWLRAAGLVATRLA
jgi:hypothetical protein